MPTSPLCSSGSSRQQSARLLELFARAHGELDAEEHRRLLRWCQLERRLLDAGFAARRRMTATEQLPGLDELIADAAADVLQATELLEAAPRRLALA